VRSPDETRRLLDDPEIEGELKLGLERISSNLPSAEQLASLAARVGVTPDGAPASGQAPASKTLLKIAAGAGISGAVLWALLRGSTPGALPSVSPAVAPLTSSHAEGSAPIAPAARTSNGRAPAVSGGREERAPAAGASDDASLETPEPPARRTETPEVSAPSGRSSAESPRASERPAPPSERAGQKAPTRTPAPSTESSPAPARAPVAAPPSETALLRDARLALSGDPARALALTEQHRREYPSGGFSQEREVIAITALGRLGRTSEARGRAERFRSAYPTSPYIERIDRAVPP
jgi:hypothetical protein